MRAEIELRLRKAESLLAQLSDLDPATKPEAIIHLAYYAMFHAAVAALIARTGAAATRHSSLVSQFGRLMTTLGEEGKTHGKALNRALDLRLLADYGVDHPSLSEAADVLARDARAFVLFCKGLVR